MEHRQAQRESAEITVLLSTADGVTCKGRITDVSSLGAGIVLSNGNLARGVVVKIRVLTDEAKSRMKPMQSLGYIVRAQNNEFGLLWVNEGGQVPVFGQNSQDTTSNPTKKLRIA